VAVFAAKMVEVKDVAESFFLESGWAVTVHFASKSMLDREEANRDFRHRKFVTNDTITKQDLQANVAFMHAQMRCSPSGSSAWPQA
jgi:hypothetical protein